MAGAGRRDLFKGTAPYYARYRPGYPEPFFARLAERFRLDGTGRLLDLGCGTGQMALPLAGRFQEVVGMDPEPEMLAEAALQARAAGVHISARCASWDQSGSPSSTICGKSWRGSSHRANFTKTSLSRGSSPGRTDPQASLRLDRVPHVLSPTPR